MDLPFEVSVIIFSYLKIKDLIDVSSVCKTYYSAVRKNKLSQRKLFDSRQLFSNERLVWLLLWCVCLFCLWFIWIFEEEYGGGSNLDCLRDVMIDKVYYSILPFRIWNHFFLCERSLYVKNICLDCTNYI